MASSVIPREFASRATPYLQLWLAGRSGEAKARSSPATRPRRDDLYQEFFREWLALERTTVLRLSIFLRCGISPRDRATIAPRHDVPAPVLFPGSRAPADTARPPQNKPCAQNSARRDYSNSKPLPDVPGRTLFRESPARVAADRWPRHIFSAPASLVRGLRGLPLHQDVLCRTLPREYPAYACRTVPRRSTCLRSYIAPLN